MIFNINKYVVIENENGMYSVIVWCAGACQWIRYERFSTIEEAVAWANIPDNVR